uniref:Uncharacterized protein AlNc14C3G390 n=1 Tax=Albugo laibachii Nc14 TaxID=890382 RepID=F0VZR1_9STRA|nr:conserved hypothetical protein [Albugo laibachii Nc14]|eukprot:CCA14282.1 conserved hypothetical protein [Albugo laibachii Nc14]
MRQRDSLLITLISFVGLLGWILAKEVPAMKHFSALSPPFKLKMGEVTNRFERVPIPKGPIAIHQFQAEVVEVIENNGKQRIIPVPLSDAYLHHYVIGSPYEFLSNKSEGKSSEVSAEGYRFGAGTESRGTPQNYRFPYASVTLPDEDEWIVNIHVINTRNMSTSRAHRCLECPCTSEDSIRDGKINGVVFTNHTCNAQLMEERNAACSIGTYSGGLRCCEDGEFCLEKEELSEMDTAHEKSVIYLRYTILYGEVVPETRPVLRATCCDATGDLEVKGNVEYNIPLCDPEFHPGCVHSLSTRQPIDTSHSHERNQTNGTRADRMIDIVSMIGHQHLGGMGMFVYDDQTSELLCSSIPQYGRGHEVNNELGYVVAMSSCEFNPPIRRLASDILRIVALYNNTNAHSGAMSLVFVGKSELREFVGFDNAISDTLVPDASANTRSNFVLVLIYGVVPALLAFFTIGFLWKLSARRAYNRLLSPR